MTKFHKKIVIAVAALILPLGLVSCGAKMTADEAAVEPCKTFQLYIDSFLARDMRGAAGHADVGSKQFAKISSDFAQFSLYASVLEGATDNGVVDDLAGYMKLLKYCGDINKGTK
jgi:hypothetical protein